MADKVKKGDIVFIEGWGGVIGRVTSYDPQSKTLTLEWPKDLSPYNYVNPQPFSCPEDVLTRTHVLSNDELFTKMLELRAQTVDALKANIIAAVKYATSRL
jgi:hypothetical protein